jgi:hypothetical protein
MRLPTERLLQRLPTYVCAHVMNRENIQEFPWKFAFQELAEFSHLFKFVLKSYNFKDNFSLRPDEFRQSCLR